MSVEVIEVQGARGLLRSFNEAGLLEAADVHAASRITALAKESDETVALAVALAVRALRAGSVCVDLRTVGVQSGAAELAWPEPESWLATVRASSLAATPAVLRLHDGHLLYFDRYWREEQQVCDDLIALSSATVSAGWAGAERLFPAGYEEQAVAAGLALSQPVTVLTGGPGTGKTTTVARLLALLAEQAALAGKPGPRIALAAPTGKAAARLQEAVSAEVAKLDAVDRERLGALAAVTLHRLLGSRADSSVRFRHNRANRLPHDLIVIDETSMVSLTMMARLLEAVRPGARLVLVGDPDQLASVEAGAVLADVVDGLGEMDEARVASLRSSHRFGESIASLADAIRVGDGNLVLELLRAGGGHVEFIEDDDPGERLRPVLLSHAWRVREAAVVGDAPAALTILGEHRLLCGHREGRYGVGQWNRQVRRWLAEVTGEPVWPVWYAGRPLLITANDYGLGVYNGDTGVVVIGDGGLRAMVGSLNLATSRLSDVETMYAMTIHKSQGGQADEVTVVLPPEDSRLLTRELFYTAVTRAKRKVRVAGSEAQVRLAVARRASRASGLRQRLQSRGSLR